MGLQINDTDVIDSNKNIVSGTPSVQGTIVKATVSSIAPTGTTAQRPSSPSIGMLFFDTDEGKLVSYNGTEWV
tara:strand:+ start:328 stop:546 length:219 start_codon:yes stop_codon:yes gene_type:complete